MSVAKSLIRGATEALTIVMGEIEPAASNVPDTVDVAAIRKQPLRSGFVSRLVLFVIGSRRAYHQIGHLSSCSRLSTKTPMWLRKHWL